MRNNKKIIIVISIILILAIVSSAFAYLYLMTDLLKNKKEVFAQYFTQQIDSLEEITKIKGIEIYNELKKEPKYESNINIKVIHSEGGEISNPINNLQAKLDLQKDNGQQYLYADGQILYNGEEYLEAEIMRNENLYGIRFTDAVLQFITVRNDEKLESVANSLGMEVSQLQEIINMVSGENQTQETSGFETIKNTYSNIIINGISKGTFEKQNQAMITYNNTATKTNAYSVFLTSEQVYNIIIEILNNLKNETFIQEKLQIGIDKEQYEKEIDKVIEAISNDVKIPEIKITVYVKDKQTIRSDIEIGTYKITIENMREEKKLETKIVFGEKDQEKQINAQIIKQNVDNTEDFEVIIELPNEENVNKINFLNKTQSINNELQLSTEISYEENITKQSIVLENKLTIGNDFKKKQTFDELNKIVLNDANEEKRKVFIERLKPILARATSERIKMLNEKIKVSGQENTETENQVSQPDINKFNSKFEFYTGEEVSAENVKQLLEIVKEHLGNYEILEPSNQQNEGNTNQEKQKTNIKLVIEKDKLNEEGFNKVLEKIKTGKKYKVSIFYKDSNGLIDFITIIEV